MIMFKKNKNKNIYIYLKHLFIHLFTLIFFFP